MNVNRTTLYAALLAVGIATGAVAQTSGPSGSASGSTSAATPAPPASGSTGMDKGAGSTTTPAKTASAPKAGADTSALNTKDRKFLEEAYQDSRAEVEISKMAMEKASDAKVKDFAKKMVDEHSKSLDEIKKIASAKGVTLPADLERGSKRLMDKLAKKSGHDFDKEYIDEMEDDHQKDLRKFRAMAKAAKDPDVKAFASGAVPTLEQHLQLAKSTESEVKAAGRRTTTTTAGTPRDTSTTTAKSGSATGGGPTGTAKSTATPGKDTAATTGTAGPGTGMPSSTRQDTGTAPQPPGSASDTKTTSPPK